MRLAPAYLLVTHGSRAPRPQIAAELLASLLCQKLGERNAIDQSIFYSQSDRQLGIEQKLERGTAILSKPTVPLVDTACLELASISLHERIEQFAKQVQENGLERLEILPLFLLPGVHVKEDIPREIAIAQQTLGKTVKLELRPYLGSYSGLIHLLAKQLKRLPTQARIVLSHGSRRRGGNQPCEAIAAQLNAIPAYWSMSPTLSEQVEVLAQQGRKSIAILPYFLFCGGITDAIAQQVQQLQQAFPNLTLLLGEPLGATVELANLIIEEIDAWIE